MLRRILGPLGLIAVATAAAAQGNPRPPAKVDLGAVDPQPPQLRFHADDPAEFFRFLIERE